MANCIEQLSTFYPNVADVKYDNNQNICSNQHEAFLLLNLAQNSNKQILVVMTDSSVRLIFTQINILSMAQNTNKLLPSAW